MENFKLQYRDLEQRDLANLRYKISISKKYSKHVQEKCLKVNILSFTEIVNINDRLTFLDEDGLHYNWQECDLENLIDILIIKK